MGEPSDAEVADTIASPPELSLAETLSLDGASRTSIAITRQRSTVLPRREAPEAPIGSEQRFRRVRPLGEGGLGEVVLALDEDIRRKVAIKRVRQEVASPSTLLRFADEVRIIGQLEHPGIVPVHDVGIDEEGKHYLVMKYVEGETLERVIERLREGDPEAVRRYGMSQRLEIVAKILEALSYAHARGFIHRDLKPANVMVGPHGEVTLMDWGIAKRVGTEDDAGEIEGWRSERLVETRVGTILGTPLYMSPEQARGANRELDARSDVFAMGLVMLELFTLKHPFEELRDVTAVIATLLTKELGTFAELHPRFAAAKAPMDVMWVTLRALRLDPAARYADAGEMLAEIDAVRAGEGPVRCHITATRRAASGFVRWVDRHPRAWTVTLWVAAFAILASIGMGVWGIVRALTG